MTQHALSSARGSRVSVAALALAAVLFPAHSVAATDTVGFSVVSGPLGYGGSGGAPSIPAPAPTGGTSPGHPGITDVGDRPNELRSRMPDFEVSDASGGGRGWSITVSGDTGRDRSPLLKQYCPLRECPGGHRRGYVVEGVTLPPNSLTFDSSGASFEPVRGSAGRPPTFRCGDACFVDVFPGSPSKLAVAEVGSGMGTFRARGFSPSSIKLVAPNAPPTLPPGQIYRVDLSWTLNSGP
jgi:hypothetical protein